MDVILRELEDRNRSVERKRKYEKYDNQKALCKDYDKFPLKLIYLDRIRATFGDSPDLIIDEGADFDENAE